MTRRIGRIITQGLLVVWIILIIGLPLSAETPKRLILGNENITISWYGRQTEEREAATPKVALVLSGGGARGFAHVPVIEALEVAGIPIDMVLGTSMGSLVGGLYAAGYSPGDMRRLIDSYDMVELFALSALPPLISDPAPLRKERDNLFILGFDSSGLGAASGLIGDQRILHMLNDSLSRVSGITDFDELAIPFRCIGADLATGERIVFSEGSLVSSIRSSISIPLVFTPYPMDGRLVVDGGLVDNMPVTLAREMGADIVIAVDVNAVDYEIEAQELDSLTDVLTQLVVILTKNTVIEQSKDADLLVTPKLSDHEVLDFIDVDEIITVGEESIRSHAEDIYYLAQRIQMTRPLEKQDPTRYGVYFSLPDVYVRSVTHRAVGSYTPSEDPFDLEPFERFVGYPLDWQNKQRLNALFEDLRLTQGYATITYAYTDASLGKADTVWGNLEIQTRQFGPKQSSIAAGIYGALSLSFDTNSPVSFRFAPDFVFRYTNHRVFDEKTSLQVLLKNEDALTVSSLLRHRFAQHFSFGVEAGYTTGGIHPLNLRSTGLDVRDRMVTSELFVDYSPSSRHLVKLATDFDYIWYGEDVVGHEDFITTVRFDGVYNTIPFRFFPKNGFRIDFSFLSEINGIFGYRLEARVQNVVPLGARDALWFDLHAGSAHVSNPRKDSYFDYGGSRGIPSYPAMTLVDDMVIARIKHLHWMPLRFSEMVLQTMVTASARGRLVQDLLSDTNPYIQDRAIPFSSLSMMEYSGSIALGLATEQIDVLFGVALDNNLRVSIFLEVL